MDQKTLITNNTIPAGINNAIESPSLTLINLSPEIYGDVTNGALGFTNPALSVNESDGVKITPVPSGVYIPSDFNLLGEYIPSLTSNEGNISPILNGDPVPVVNTLVPAALDPIIPSRIVTVTVPNQLDTDIPFNLDTDYISSTMLPASYSLNEAIEKVIECNCDCWIN
jgi:hypothetical protein